MRSLLNTFIRFKHIIGKKIWIFFLLIFLVSVLDGFGIMMVFPLLNSFGDEKNEISNEVLNYIDHISGAFSAYLGLDNQFMVMLSLIIIIYTLKALVNYASMIVVALMRGQLFSDLRNKVATYFLESSYEEVIKNNSGYYSNLVSDQINRTVHSFMLYTDSLIAIVNALMMIAIALYIKVTLTITLLCGGFLVFIFFKNLSVRVRIHSDSTANQSSKLIFMFNEMFSSSRYLYATRQIEKVTAKLKNSINLLTVNEIEFGRARAKVQTFREPITLVLLTTGIAIEIYVFDTAFSVMTIALLVMYRGITSILVFQSTWQSFNEFRGSFDYVYQQIINLKQYKLGVQEFNLLNTPKRTNLLIEFDNIKFCYQGSKNLIVLNNLSIDKGEFVGLVGASGSGKSSLIAIMLGLYSPNSGNVRYSVDMLKAFESHQIGFVPQDPILFEGSVIENVTLQFDSLSEANIEKVKNLLMLVGLYDFLEDRQGLDTKLGESGIGLSGGQAQRLSIARELYREPLVLILDEPTSALDSQSEEVVLDFVRSYCPVATIIMITHDLELLNRTDRVIVMDNGCVFEQGKFDDLLLKKNGLLKKLYVKSLV